MSRSLKIKNSFSDIVLTPNDILTLAKQVFKPWEENYKNAEHIWENEKLPDIRKKIDQHNDDVKNKKSVYSFNTNLEISDESRINIIEKEKNYFIHTSLRVYLFDSNFTVSFSNGKEESSTDPLFLEHISWSKVEELEFRVTTRGIDSIKDRDKNILITIAKNKNLKYMIEAVDDDDWVHSQKSQIEYFVSDLQKIKKLPTPFFLNVIVITAIFVYSTSMIAKRVLELFDWNQNHLYLFSMLMALFSTFFIYPIYDSLFPRLVISKKYEQFNNTFLRITVFIFSGLMLNALYELLKVLFDVAAA